MIDAASFLAASGRAGVSFYTGVPCSFLTPLINRTASDAGLQYVGATSEGEAVAIAAGAWLGGRTTCVMCQNSGLGNAINPLTSLNAPFRIPTLLIVTWRGEPGRPDEPQHALMGRITQRLLDTIEVPHLPFPEHTGDLDAAVQAATDTMAETGRPFALVMRQGSVADEHLDQPPHTRRPPGHAIDLRARAAPPSRAEILERLLAESLPELPVIATTGKTGRELFTLADREQQLYQVGSMGGASPMALGLALVTGRRVLVLDGDGAALMKLGSLATIGAYQPPGFVHVLLDNGVHDSTGGQATVSPAVDFAAIALACGYRAAIQCDDSAGFSDALRQALAMTGPVMIHIRIRPGSMATLGRPTIAPHEAARRFRDFVARQQAPGRSLSR